MPISIFLLIFSQTIDGTLVAAKEFSFVIRLSIFTCFLQMVFLWVATKWNLGLPCIFASLGARYLTFVFAVSWKARPRPLLWLIGLRNTVGSLIKFLLAQQTTLSRASIYCCTRQKQRVTASLS